MHINAYEAQPLTTTGCWVGAEQVVMTLLLASTVLKGIQEEWRGVEEGMDDEDQRGEGEGGAGAGGQARLRVVVWT